MASMSMAPFVRTFAAAIAAMAAVLLFSAMPAQAITAELAKKCREMATKAHPIPKTGKTADAARAHHQYYRICVARDGKME
jgi:hypothetical protein